MVPVLVVSQGRALVSKAIDFFSFKNGLKCMASTKPILVDAFLVALISNSASYAIPCSAELQLVEVGLCQ